MGEALDRDRLDERISYDDLFFAQCSRVAFVSGLGVRLQHFTYARQAFKEFHSERSRERTEVAFGGLKLRWRRVLKAFDNLSLKVGEHFLHQRFGFSFDF